MDVVTLGETMILFTPLTKGNMRYASTFTAKVAGAEANVAIGLARLGHTSGWMSRLGQDEFGKKVLSFLRGEGVDVSAVQFDSSAPTGLYFKEIITDDEINVQYYRRDSAASKMIPSDLDENYIANAKYLHITGITPALSESCKETLFTAIDYAKQHGVTVVFDPNLRRKLWSESEAREVLKTIALKSDIVLPGIDEGSFLFGEHDPQKIAHAFQEIGASKVVVKLGTKGAYYVTESSSGYVDAYPVPKVVDPVGAGDGFVAGFLSGLLDGLSFRNAVDRGAAVGAMVTKIAGDVEGLPERDRLEAFVQGIAKEDVNR